MRGEKRLTARQVATLGEGYHADGGGLYLQVSRTGARSWIFRYQLDKRRREMGLGAASAVSLLQARQRASEARTLVAHGTDPIAARDAARTPGMTFGEAAAAYIASHKTGWKTPAQAEQWEQSLRDHGPPAATPIADVDTPVVLAALSKIWTTKTETASRLRGRIERILDWARVAGHRGGENPARWRGHLDKLLPKPSKVAKVKHHAAMPYADVPAFYRRLPDREAKSRIGLRFTILTAVRTEETVGAAWREFDLDAGLWTIPPERMKSGREHVVPLPEAALAILRGFGKLKPDDQPFKMSENTMLYLVQKPPPKGYGLPYTVHGFRSSFRDWAAETTDYPKDVVEMALAHVIKDKTEAAYRRGKLLDKRRALMADWAAYVTGGVAPHETPPPHTRA
jgi:integrase